MQSNLEKLLPSEHILIGVIPSLMIMPGASSYLIFDGNKTSEKILEYVKAGNSPHFFVVMSDPQKKETPDRFYRLGVVAKTDLDPQNPVVYLNAVIRAEMVSLRRIEGPDWAIWVANVKEVKDESCDDFFLENLDKIMANMIKIRDLLSAFLTRSRGFYEFDHRHMAMLVGRFETVDWEDKDEVDSFVWSALGSTPDLFQKDKQPFLESTS